MKRRRGFSLILVLFFCALLSLCMAHVSLSIQWAGQSTAAGERRLLDRLLLSALIGKGRRWLEAEISSGHLPESGERPIPKKFSQVRLLRIDEEDARVDIYDLDYEPAEVPIGGWDPSQGVERFFPPGPKMFLLRAFKFAGRGTSLMVEVVLRAAESETGNGAWILERRPLLWQEIWLSADVERAPL